jgi:hypothetical protein
VGGNVPILKLAVPPFSTKIILGIWAWFSTGPWTWMILLNMHPVLFLPLPTGYLRRFVQEHALANRPHTSLWLAKTYVIPAGMYGSQVWGAGFWQAGREFSSSVFVGKSGLLFQWG